MKGSWHVYADYTFKITNTSPKDQWVNEIILCLFADTRLMIFPKIITTTSSVAHLTITVKMLHLYILTAFISVVRHGTALNNSIITSDNRVGSSSGVGSPSHNHVEALQVQAIPQNYTTDLVLMVSRNISTPVTPGIPTPPRACGSNGRGVLHLVLTVWECYKPYACCGGAGLVLVVLIIIIVVIVKRYENVNHLQCCVILNAVNIT